MKKINICILATIYTVVASCGKVNEHHNHEHDHENNHKQIEATEEHHHEHLHNGERHISHDDKNIVVFTHKQAENANLKTVTLKKAPFANVIKCSGDIVSSPSDAMYIVAPSNGIILFGDPYPVDGVKIEEGDNLFSISSANIQDGDLHYRTKLEYERAKKNYERATELAKHKIVSERELLDATIEFENAKAAYNAFGGEGSNNILVKAPSDGYISQINVNNGDYVNIGQVIAMVSKNKKLQLRADIERESFNHLPNIKTANFILTFDDTVYKLSEMNGKLLSYGKYIEHGENFIPITFEFENRHNIIPGSYADIFLITKQEENSLAIPESAVCEEEGLLYVYRRIDCEHFYKTYIGLGDRNGEMIKVESGLNEGDIVVTDGVHQLKAASRASIIPEGHSHNH